MLKVLRQFRVRAETDHPAFAIIAAYDRGRSDHDTTWSSVLCDFGIVQSQALVIRHGRIIPFVPPEQWALSIKQLHPLIIVAKQTLRLRRRPTRLSPYRVPMYSIDYLASINPSDHE